MILLEQFFRVHRIKRAAAAEKEEQYDCNQNANGNEWRARADGSANIRKTGFSRVFLRRGGNDSGIPHSASALRCFSTSKRTKACS